MVGQFRAAARLDYESRDSAAHRVSLDSGSNRGHARARQRLGSLADWTITPAAGVLGANLWPSSPVAANPLRLAGV
jgi:hypothetical protein